MELVRRLPRGGFRIQFSPQAFSFIQSSEPPLELHTFGTWKLWHSPTPNTCKYLVLNPVPPDISDSELIQELAYANTSVHGMTPSEVKTQIRAVSRLQFRHRDTKELQASRSIRLFCEDTLYEKIFNCSSIFLGHCAIHARPYTPPQYRCYKCNAIGSHKAEYCRSQRIGFKPVVASVASSSTTLPPPEAMDIEPMSAPSSQQQSILDQILRQTMLDTLQATTGINDETAARLVHAKMKDPKRKSR